jgi:hypothetical protein
VTFLFVKNVMFYLVVSQKVIFKKPITLNMYLLEPILVLNLQLDAVYRCHEIFRSLAFLVLFERAKSTPCR